MTDDKTMKQLALRLAAHLKKRDHAVPFEVLTHVLAALRGFTNWHVFLKAQPTEAPRLQLTGDPAYFTDVLSGARQALKAAPAVGEIYESAHHEVQSSAALTVEDALVALKAQMTVDVSDPEPLDEARRKAAERAYNSYQFGESVTIEDDEGWEGSTHEAELTRKVLVRTDEGDDVGGSVKLVFHVRFSTGSAKILEVFARDAKGSDWGGLATDAIPDPGVFVAIYDYKHGNTVRVFASEAAALGWRTQIAVDYWDESFGDAEDFGPKPDRAMIGEQYFDLMREGDGYVESFDITHAAVEG
jgi:hypothetical protein